MTVKFYVTLPLKLDLENKETVMSQSKNKTGLKVLKVNQHSVLLDISTNSENRMSIWKHFEKNSDSPSQAFQKLSTVLAIVVCIVLFLATYSISNRLIVALGLAFSLLGVFLILISVVSRNLNNDK